MSLKRVLIATLSGILFGIVALLIANSAYPDPLSRKMIATIFTSRVLIGFVIGISACKIIWPLHGILMGIIVSIPFSFGAMAYQTPVLGKWHIFFLTLVLGAVYGLLIELITSVIFKAKHTQEVIITQ
ncbi:MAG: hypothetical protein M0P53_03145 [Candidatus Cloacimonas sp.]|nr:hypothetical protein [Candidatus Cloacimonas sp.]